MLATVMLVASLLALVPGTAGGLLGAGRARAAVPPRPSEPTTSSGATAALPSLPAARSSATAALWRSGSTESSETATE